MPSPLFFVFLLLVTVLNMRYIDRYQKSVNEKSRQRAIAVEILQAVRTYARKQLDVFCPLDRRVRLRLVWTSQDLHEEVVIIRDPLCSSSLPGASELVAKASRSTRVSLYTDGNPAIVIGEIELCPACCIPEAVLYFIPLVIGIWIYSGQTTPPVILHAKPDEEENGFTLGYCFCNDPNPERIVSANPEPNNLVADFCEHRQVYRRPPATQPITIDCSSSRR